MKLRRASYLKNYVFLFSVETAELFRVALHEVTTLISRCCSVCCATEQNVLVLYRGGRSSRCKSLRHRRRTKRKYRIGSWANRKRLAKTRYIRRLTTSLHLSLKCLESILPNVGLAERTWKNTNNERRRKDDKNAKIASFGDDSNDYNVRCHDPHNKYVKHCEYIFFIFPILVEMFQNKSGPDQQTMKLKPT